MTGYTLGTVGTASNNGTGNDFSANMPSSFSANDLLIGVSRARGSSDTFTTPSGWTALLNAVLGNGSISVFAKIAAGGDAAPTISWAGSGQVYCQIMNWTGDVYTDLSTIVHVSNTITGTASTCTVPSATVSLDNCLILGVAGKNKTATSDGAFITVSGAFAEVAQSVPSGGGTHMNAIGFVQQTTATNISQTDWTDDVGENLSRSGVTLALKSQAPGASVEVQLERLFRGGARGAFRGA